MVARSEQLADRKLAEAQLKAQECLQIFDTEALVAAACGRINLNHGAAVELSNRGLDCRTGKRLDPARLVMLELDQRSGEYHDFGGVPENLSQGWFEFGPDCASVLRARARFVVRS